MIKRSTWVLLVIFAVLLALVLLLPQLKGKEPEPSATSTPPLESPFTFSVSDVVELRIESNDGKTVIVNRNEDNTWKLVEPDKETSEENSVEGVVAGIVNINLISKIDPAPPADVSGLAKPVYTVTMVNKDGGEEGLLIGNLTPTSSGYYVETDDGQVYVAEKLKIDPLIDLVQNPPIKVTPTPEVQGSDTPAMTVTVTTEMGGTPQITPAIPPTAGTVTQTITSPTSTP